MATTPKTSATTALPKNIFAVEIANHELLKLAYESYLANGRVATATTKTRGEVSGGGKKPWRQKGTGRARFGSTRNPIWRTGGVVFGPSGNENYTKKLPQRSKMVALRQALTLANKSGTVTVIDTFACPEGKTKETVALLKQNNVTDKDRTLLVVSAKDDLVKRATANIQNVKAVQAKYLNVYDIMNADRILVSKKSLEIIQEWLGGDK